MSYRRGDISDRIDSHYEGPVPTTYPCPRPSKRPQSFGLSSPWHPPNNQLGNRHPLHPRQLWIPATPETSQHGDTEDDGIVQGYLSDQSDVDAEPDDVLRLRLSALANGFEPYPWVREVVLATDLRNPDVPHASGWSSNCTESEGTA